jgi:RNA polymerase sigma-70 factor (ECF subfamily)
MRSTENLPEEIIPASRTEPAPLPSVGDREELRRLLLRDDPRAFDRLYALYAKRLLAYAQAVTCHAQDAEDALQQAFAKLARKKRRLAKARNFTGYLFAIVRNSARDILRQRARRAESALEERDWIEPRDAGLEEQERVQSLRRALEMLPEEQRAVIVLHVFEEMKFREIAEVLGKSLNTITARYRYGIDKLRKMKTDIEP